MPTQIITLKDGIKVEAEVTDLRVAARDGRVDETIDSLRPTLLRVIEPVTAAWADMASEVTIEKTEIELAFGFEASGTVFLASAKGNMNLKVKLVLGPNTPRRSPAP